MAARGTGQYDSYCDSNGDLYGQVWPQTVLDGSVLLRSMKVSVFKWDQWSTPKAECRLQPDFIGKVNL